jgi:hypothetical protein
MRSSLSEAAFRRNLSSSQPATARALSRSSSSDLHSSHRAAGPPEDAPLWGATAKGVPSVEEILAEHAGRHLAPTAPAWVVRCMQVQETLYRKLVAQAEQREQQAEAEAARARAMLAEAERALVVPGAALVRSEGLCIEERLGREQAQLELASLRDGLARTAQRLRESEERNSHGAEEVHWLRGELAKRAEMERVARGFADAERGVCAGLRAALSEAEETATSAQREVAQLRKSRDAARGERVEIRTEQAESAKQRTADLERLGRLEGMVLPEDPNQTCSHLLCTYSTLTLHLLCTCSTLTPHSRHTYSTLTLHLLYTHSTLAYCSTLAPTQCSPSPPAIHLLRCPPSSWSP